MPGHLHHSDRATNIAGGNLTEHQFLDKDQGQLYQFAAASDAMTYGFLNRKAFKDGLNLRRNANQKLTFPIAANWLNGYFQLLTVPLHQKELTAPFGLLNNRLEIVPRGNALTIDREDMIPYLQTCLLGRHTG